MLEVIWHTDRIITRHDHEITLMLIARLLAIAVIRCPHHRAKGVRSQCQKKIRQLLAISTNG
jgi:hypothetical protein